MGKVLHDLGDFPKAIQAYEKALGLKPDDRDALTGLIRCLMSSDLPDQAEALVARALEKYPDDSTVLGFAASSAYHANRLDQAIALADRALARDPKNLECLAGPSPDSPGSVAMGASLARRGTRPCRSPPQQPGRAPIAPEN